MMMADNYEDGPDSGVRSVTLIRPDAIN